MMEKWPCIRPCILGATNCRPHSCGGSRSCAGWLCCRSSAPGSSNRQKRSESSHRCINRNGPRSSGRSRPSCCRSPKRPMCRSRYVIRRHAEGGGRKDILALGDPDSASPYLVVEIYRPGSEIGRFAGPQAAIAATAAALGPVALRSTEEPLVSKFGPLSIIPFETSKGTPRHCLAFVRTYDDPRLQLSGWFCQGGADFIERSTLACALDRLTLLFAGSEPKVGALFAQAELNRSFCGQRDPILASTPKYKLLWKALATRPEPRRIGR